MREWQQKTRNNKSTVTVETKNLCQRWKTRDLKSIFIFDVKLTEGGSLCQFGFSNSPLSLLSHPFLSLASASPPLPPSAIPCHPTPTIALAIAITLANVMDRHNHILGQFSALFSWYFQPVSSICCVLDDHQSLQNSPAQSWFKQISSFISLELS